MQNKFEESFNLFNTQIQLSPNDNLQDTQSKLINFLWPTYA